MKIEHMVGQVDQSEQIELHQNFSIFLTAAILKDDSIDSKGRFVNGGVKPRRVAGQNRGTLRLIYITRYLLSICFPC